MRRKFFGIVIGIECLLLLIGIVGLFGGKAVYEFGPEDMHVNFGGWSEADGAYGTDGMEGIAGDMVDIGPIALPAGVYQVTMRYSTDTDMRNLCTVSDEQLSDRELQGHGSQMFSGRNSTDSVVWLYRDTDSFMVHAYYDGAGSLAVTGVTIEKTNALSRMWIFWVLAGSLAVNGVYWFWKYDRQHSVSVENKNVIFGLGLIILFASLPVMVDYMIGGGDLLYHLHRVEGVRDNILAGNFPGRISPKWQQGYGYASPIFYGETLIYIAAMFRLIGFSVVTSYRMFLFVIGAATALISYFCFWKIFGQKYTGLLCSMLYTISVYRIYKTYCCGSWGECFGVMFMPLLALGFYRTFTGDTGDKNYSKNWIPLTIGFTGLIQSHLLSGEMAGFFTILLCFVCIRKVFRRATFLVLAKAVVYSTLLSAWFLVPFLDYLHSGNFVIQNVSGRTIQERGLYLAHLLFTYSIAGGNVFFEAGGIADSAPVNIGAPLCALILWAGILFLRRTDKLAKEQLGMGMIASGFALLAMLMSLSVFPWDRIQRLHPVTATLVSSLQFPNRWLSIATLTLVLLSGVVAAWMRENYGKSGFSLYFAGMTVMVFLTAGYLTNDLMYKEGTMRIYNPEGMGTGYIAGAEYLPYWADVSLFVPHRPHAEDGLEVADYEQGALSADITCRNGTETEKALELALLYYKGYQAYDAHSGERLPVYSGTNFAVGVAVPSGYDGTVKVIFESPWYWRAGELISVLTFVVLAAGCRWQKRRERISHESRSELESGMESQ